MRLSFRAASKMYYDLPDNCGQLPQGTREVKTTLPLWIGNVGRLDICCGAFHIPCQIAGSFPHTQAVRGVALVALATVDDL
jgi:hypothetical protein